MLLLGWSLPASAADFWQRTKGRALTAEAETLQALYRALEGSSDSIDELLVRVSIVDVARGKVYQEPLTLVYVLRTRRLLGLPRLRGDTGRLREVTEGDGSGETVALAAIELGRLLRLEGDGAGAKLELDRGVARAWRSETLVEARLMRGFLAIEQADPLGARADFEAALAFDLGRSQLALALSGLALSDLERGDGAGARRLLSRARALLLAGNSAMSVQPADRPELLPRDRSALLELEGRLQSSAGDGDEDDLDP